MSGLILGTAKGLSISQVYPWASSASKTGNRVVLLSMEENNILSMQMRGLGVEVVCKPTTLKDKSPHNERFKLQHDFLMNCDEEYVVVTDVRDVVFQSDPIEWIKNNIGKYEIVCSSEGLAYKDEPWGNHNLMEGYPDLYETHKHNTIVNVGVLGGKTKEVAKTCLKIYDMCGKCKAYLSDQSSFNVLCADESMKDVVYKTKSDQSFCINAGTFVRNAVGGRFVLNDSTAHLLKEPEPVIDGKILMTPSKQPYCIVHQWDRIP
jgi:hypothetical protein